MSVDELIAVIADKLTNELIIKNESYVVLEDFLSKFQRTSSPRNTDNINCDLNGFIESFEVEEVPKETGSIMLNSSIDIPSEEYIEILELLGVPILEVDGHYFYGTSDAECNLYEHTQTVRSDLEECYPEQDEQEDFNDWNAIIHAVYVGTFDDHLHIGLISSGPDRGNVVLVDWPCRFDVSTGQTFYEFMIKTYYGRLLNDLYEYEWNYADYVSFG